MTINSNCCRHITGFIIYCIPSPEISWWMVHLMGQPCVGIMSGTMQFGDIFFKDTIFVPDIEVTIFSLGHLDGEGCRTEMSNERWVYLVHLGIFLFTAFLRNGAIFWILNSIMVLTSLVLLEMQEQLHMLFLMLRLIIMQSYGIGGWGMPIYRTFTWRKYISET